MKYVYFSEYIFKGPVSRIWGIYWQKIFQIMVSLADIHLKIRAVVFLLR